MAAFIVKQRYLWGATVFLTIFIYIGLLVKLLSFLIYFRSFKFYGMSSQSAMDKYSGSVDRLLRAYGETVLPKIWQVATAELNVLKAG